MPETKTKVKLSAGSNTHKPDCQCPFCKAKRGENPRGPAKREPDKPAPLASESDSERAQRAGDFLEMLHDEGNAIWPDPRWDLPAGAKNRFGEAAAPVMEKHEVVDQVLGGNMYLKLVLTTWTIERRSSMKIIPEQGLLRKRRRKAKPDQNGVVQDFPLNAPDAADWERMSEAEQQASIEQFRRAYGGGETAPIIDNIGPAESPR
jgi:hypothetical protein